jgi:putative ABC transport system permease protein
MLKHLLKSSLRFLSKNKIYAGINAIGLSIALAVSFIILLYLINEMSWDRCHRKWARIYRVNSYLTEFSKTYANTPYVLASTLQHEYPQIEKATNTGILRGFNIKIDEQNLSIHRGVCSSSEIFDIMTIPLIGNSDLDNLLNEINSIVLSQSLAEKIFDGINPIGKNINALLDGKEKILKVTGVFEDFPPNSTFQASCFLNSKLLLDQINQTYQANNAETSWNYDHWSTWVLVKKGVRASSIENNFRALEKKYLNEKIKKQYSLQNLSDIYLRSEDIENSGIKGSITNIRIFSLIAFLVILVAATNYIILSTAVSTGRSKEIGLKKTFGADFKRIKIQLLGESVILTVIVLPVALLLMRLALPYASKLFQAELNIYNYNLTKYIAAYILLTILIGIASGIYTSYYLSRLKVLDILQNTIHFGKKRQVFRSFLIIVQLVIFCTFTSCAFIIGMQYKFALRKDLGFDKEDIAFIYIGPDFKSYNAFIDKIRSNPNVVNVSGQMFEMPSDSYAASIYPHFTNKEKDVIVESFSVDFDFLKTMGMTLVEGRDFSRDFGSDLTKSLIINQKAIKELGIEDPIGKNLGSRTIIGIVKDFNLHSIHSDIKPLIIHLTDKYILDIAIKYNHGSLNQLSTFLKNEWEKFAPGITFEFSPRPCCDWQRRFVF